MRRWTSYSPDGRKVVIRRDRQRWNVRCGNARAENTSLNIALAQALRADRDYIANHPWVDYPTWIRTQADTIGFEDEHDE